MHVTDSEIVWYADPEQQHKAQLLDIQSIEAATSSASHVVEDGQENCFSVIFKSSERLVLQLEGRSGDECASLVGHFCRILTYEKSVDQQSPLSAAAASPGPTQPGPGATHISKSNDGDGSSCSSIDIESDDSTVRAPSHTLQFADKSSGANTDKRSDIADGPIDPFDPIDSISTSDNTTSSDSVLCDDSICMQVAAISIDGVSITTP